MRDNWRTIAKMLLDAGADYDIRSACYLGDIDRVRVLIKDEKQLRDADAMRIAATFGRENIVKLMLARGAHPYQQHAVRIEAILLPGGARQALRMNTKQPIRKVINKNENVVRLLEGSGDPSWVTLEGLEAGVSWLTLTDPKGKEEKVLVVVEKPTPEKPVASNVEAAKRIDAILLPEGTMQELRMKTVRPIRKVVNEKETVLHIPEKLGDPTWILIEGRAPGTSWLTLTDAEGVEEKLLIVVIE